MLTSVQFVAKNLGKNDLYVQRAATSSDSNAITATVTGSPSAGSYTFIPLSSIVFPHIGIFCLTARRLSHFRRTVVLYPICMLAIWLPSVFLGVVAAWPVFGTRGSQCRSDGNTAQFLPRASRPHNPTSGYLPFVPSNPHSPTHCR